MLQILPEGWRVHQGVGIGLCGFIGWKLGEFLITTLPAILAGLSTVGAGTGAAG